MEIFIPNKEQSGCGLSGVINRKGEKIKGEVIIESICCQMERGNGLGAGYAAYGIYPEFAEYYCLHVMADHKRALKEVEEILAHKCYLVHQERIPHPLHARHRLSPAFHALFCKTPLRRRA